jgi:fatty acid-binding protein DegV
MGLAGFHTGKGADPAQLARSAVRKMQPEVMYRVVIAHANNANGAAQLRHHVLEGHGRIHSCHITEAGPALGAHFGPGGLIVGFAPQPPVLS